MECRLAQKGEMDSQKNIWKQTFGDEDIFIDFYYSQRYREEETAVLAVDGELAAMLTMIPVRIILPDRQTLNASMLYAIATHPEHQGKGFATSLMDDSFQKLKSNQVPFTILVPAQESLFGFYEKRGYHNGFCLREVILPVEQIHEMVSLSQEKNNDFRMIAAEPHGYNLIRKDFLQGRKYVDYADREIAYQKSLSQLSGADIYLVDMDNKQGCIAVERISQERVIIKEMLLPREYLEDALAHLATMIPAKEYILRTPDFLEHRFGGEVVPFGMVRADGEDLDLFSPGNSGYLGLAFD